MTEIGNLAGAVASGDFVVTAQCRPPRGGDVDRLKKCAADLRGVVHAISAPESEDGPRQSSLAACAHLADAGVEPILHLLTRDMNRIALQSAILGAASMGVRNVLCLSGRHQTLTTSSSARGVFDIDPIQLLRVADGMRKEGRLADGQTMDSPIELFLGTDTNPFADLVDLQLVTLQKAVSAGVDFVITQPVFDMERFGAWMSAVREHELHDRTCIIAGLLPLTSREQAASLMGKYRSLMIPDSILDLLEGSSSPRASGIKIAVENLERLRDMDGVRGVHLMTGEDFELAKEILSASVVARS